jgi:hypothetical protein
MKGLLLKFEGKPSIEMYCDYFIVDSRKFYFKDVSKVLFLPGKEPWWYKLFIITLAILTLSYQHEVTSGFAELHIYMNDDSKLGHLYIYKVIDKNGEFPKAYKLIKSKVEEHA